MGGKKNTLLKKLLSALACAFFKSVFFCALAFILEVCSLILLQYEMLHKLTTKGIDNATQRHFNLKDEIETKHKAKFIHRLEGYINFIGQVRGKNDSLYSKHKAIFETVFPSAEHE